jgi:hypothetical protein
MQRMASNNDSTTTTLRRECDYSQFLITPCNAIANHVIGCAFFHSSFITCNDGI